MNAALSAAAGGFLGFAACGAASAATLYSNDFELNAAGFSGSGGRQDTQGYAAFGGGGQFWRNDTEPAAASTLSVNLGSAAGGVVLSLSLAVIDSWDNGSVGFGPDQFNVSVDGNPVFAAVFDNFLNQGATTAPGLATVSYGSQLAYNGNFSDAAYTLSLNLGSLSAGAHTVQFQASGPGWQGGDDESWAVDNVLLVGAPVPEPASALLLALGLAGLCVGRRARRR